MGDFKIIDDAGEGSSTVKYQLGKIYGEAFPALSNQVVYAVEGVKDAAKQKATDLVGNGFKVPTNKNEAALIAYSAIPEVTITPANVVSYLNTPIIQPIVFKAGNYEILNNGEAAIRNITNDYMLPASVICEFSRSKIIAESNINGSFSSVKEQWGFTDWSIEMKGLIFTEGSNQGRNADIFPEDHITQLLEWDEICDSVEITGLMFGLLKIKRIVIKKIMINDIKGYPNVKSFQASCSSDESFELIIKNNNLGN